MPDDNGFSLDHRTEEFRRFINRKTKRLTEIARKIRLPTATTPAEVVSDIVKDAWEIFDRNFKNGGNLNEAYDNVENSQKDLEQEARISTEEQ